MIIKFSSSCYSQLLIAENWSDVNFHQFRISPKSTWCATNSYQADTAFRSFQEESRLFLAAGFDVGGRRDE